MEHDSPIEAAGTVDVSIAATLPEIMPVAFADETIATHAGSAPRPSPLPWLIALALVVAFGYLSDNRRAALGAFADQVSDVIRDFRGYDPEV